MLHTPFSWTLYSEVSPRMDWHTLLIRFAYVSAFGLGLRM